MYSNTDGVRERSLSQLALEITSGAVRLAAATAAWLRLVAEFDRREGWHAVGVLSCAHWLAWQCGMSPGAAREHVRVARALTTLPRLTTAFTEGRLSYSKVRALTRVAEPDTEESLLEFALAATASQTERLVRQWRRADAADTATLSLKRQFEHWWDDDGMLVLRVRLEPDQGAHLLTAIDSLAERAARRDRAEARRRAAADTPVTVGTAGDVPTGDGAQEDDQVALARERTTARRCAALVQLAEAAVDLDRRPGDPPRREVVVHVDAAVLADDTAAGRAHIEGGPSLHPSQVRRMLCGASVVSMLERGREVLAVGRARRLATRAQRRALIRRDGGCARPGCPEARIEHLHAHHMRHWTHGGPTDLSNLVLLCDADHGLVHDRDLIMTRRDGRLIVTAPDGRRVWGASDAAFVRGLAGPGSLLGPDDAFVGVHPIDQRVGRRPATAPTGEPASATQEPANRPDGVGAAELTALLFPDGPPALVEAMAANGERADIRWAVGVLMGNRDLLRRLEAESREVLAAAA
jgi:hypothetical protein